MTLSWTAPSSDGGLPVTGYDIYRGTTAGGEGGPVGTGTGTSYTDAGLANGTTYYYVVAAVNAVGTSPQSGEVSATPQGFAWPPPSRSSASAATAAAALDAFIAPGSTGSSASASSAASTELCVSVRAARSSITRGQTATYAVQVSAENASASSVSVALTSQPSSQKPVFTSGCTKGDGTASCTVGSVTAAKPANLNAQIAVASNATSVTSVKLTATASIAATATWTAPAAAATTSVTAAASHRSAKASHRSAKVSHPSAKAAQSPAQSVLGASLPPLSLGSIPSIPSFPNTGASLLIGAGNASALFPAVTPSATPSASPSPSPTALPQAGAQNAEPAADSSAVSSGTPLLTGQTAGLIALGAAIMLTVVTRRSRRKRSSSRRTDR